MQNISVPALKLKADASAEDRKAHREAADAFTNGRLVHLDDAGHNLHHDPLDQTFEVLSRFLSTLDD